MFGATIGNTLMLQPLLVAEAFGVRDYARLYSVNSLLSTVGVAAGPFVVGLIHDVDRRLPGGLRRGRRPVGGRHVGDDGPPGPVTTYRASFAG